MGNAALMGKNEARHAVIKGIYYATSYMQSLLYYSIYSI